MAWMIFWVIEIEDLWITVCGRLNPFSIIRLSITCHEMHDILYTSDLKRWNVGNWDVGTPPCEVCGWSFANLERPRKVQCDCLQIKYPLAHERCLLWGWQFGHLFQKHGWNGWLWRLSLVGRTISVQLQVRQIADLELDWIEIVLKHQHQNIYERNG